MFRGNLTISGTGTLNANSTATGVVETQANASTENVAEDDATVAAVADVQNSTGIWADDLTVDGTTVTATATSTGNAVSAHAIVAEGNMTVKNGANITAKASTQHADSECIGILAALGDMVISDSSINASAVNSSGDPAFGIEASGIVLNNGSAMGGNLSISNSAVKAEGTVAILASTIGGTIPGVLTITGSQIVSPARYVVRDCAFSVNDVLYYGQAIGAPGVGAITDIADPAIATSVELAVPAHASNTVHQASVRTDALSKTGDNTTMLLVLGALGLVGLAAAVGALIAKRRARVEG